MKDFLQSIICTARKYKTSLKQGDVESDMFFIESEAKKALAEHDSVDVESLKLETLQHFDDMLIKDNRCLNKRERVTKKAYEVGQIICKTIDHLNKRGLISGQALPHIERVDVALRYFGKGGSLPIMSPDDPDYPRNSKEHFALWDILISVSKAYAERMQPPTQGGDDD